MGKTLLNESVLKKLENLDRNISYKVGSEMITIKKKKHFKKAIGENSGDDYKEWTIYINGKETFYKKEGYERGGWIGHHDEILHLPELDIEKDKHEVKYKYHKKPDSLAVTIENNEIYFTDNERYKYFTNNKRYKMIDNYLYIKINDLITVFYIPSTQELGIKFGENITKRINEPNKNIRDNVIEIFDSYYEKSKEIYEQIIESLENTEIGKILIDYSSQQYKEIKKGLSDLLSFPQYKIEVINIANEIGKIYANYTKHLSEKQNIENQIYNFCNIVEQCLDMAANDEKEYEEELEAVKKRLRQKHNMN